MSPAKIKRTWVFIFRFNVIHVPCATVQYTQTLTFVAQYFVFTAPTCFGRSCKLLRRIQHILQVMTHFYHLDMTTCSIANCLAKIPAIFRGIHGIFRSISKVLFIYFMISHGTPNDVVPNPGWETLS